MQSSLKQDCGVTNHGNAYSQGLILPTIIWQI
jgi:hypothetical protein